MNKKVAMLLLGSVMINIVLSGAVYGLYSTQEYYAQCVETGVIIDYVPVMPIINKSISLSKKWI